MIPARSVLTVTEVTRRIKLLIEAQFPGISVQGELSNVKLHTSGHLYFTLKDEGSQIPGVMWRSRVAGLTFVPADGMKVVANGRITVYEPRGAYQLDATTLRPLGIGDLQAAFEQLKEKLLREGLFDQARKRPLPGFPRRIGIVTSPTGAALQDMLKIFRRRFPGVEVILAPTRVQGTGAAAEIASAIDDLNRLGGIDVIIAGRGGGSLEDLWAFNEEAVARAIARSTVPVVSAVGHETDVTIADFAADLRAPTPSAAAELVVKDRRALLEILRINWYTATNSMLALLESHRRNIRHLLSSHALHRPLDLLRQYSQRLDDLERTMSTAVAHRMSLHGARVGELARRLEALDPGSVLRRGYAIVRRGGTVVASAGVLAPDDRVRIQFCEGSAGAVVTEVDG